MSALAATDLATLRDRVTRARLRLAPPPPARPPPLAAPAGLVSTGFCAYCGRRTRKFACSAHSDLPAIDPDLRAEAPRWQPDTARHSLLLTRKGTASFGA